MVSASRFALWVSATRPRTLPAAVAPVLVGSALAQRVGAFHLPAAASCLGFAVLIQIGTNFANDYYDFVKGADTAERVGPRRAVASGLVAPATMRRATAVVFAIAFLVGLTLLPRGGWPLLAVGIASILCGIAYTGGPFPLGYNGLGDVFVFLFFGLVAVGTTYFVQAGWPPANVWLAAIAVGGLAANILVVNNYRDVETDRKAGKRTTVVRFGRTFARVQFVVAHFVAFAIPVILAATAVDNGGVLLLPLGLAPWAWLQAKRLREATTSPALIALLGETGRYLATYALVFSLALIWA